MKRKICFLLFIASFFFSFSSKATVVYVDSAHVGGIQNGTSWATAFSNFQAGIDAASAGDSVWVAKGTYIPAMNTSFSMKESVKILGGFLNTDTAFDQRNRETKPTILKTYSFYMPCMDEGGNLTSASLLDGFIFTGNSSTCLVTGGYSTIRNCSFRNNHSATLNGISKGVGIRNYSSSPNITDCEFVGNSCYSDDNYTPGGTSFSFGAAIYNSDASPVISNCHFVNNSTTADVQSAGAAIYNLNSSPTIVNCLFVGNTNETIGESSFFDCTSRGGAIYSIGSVVTIDQCQFNNNSCLGTKFTEGGAMYSAESSIFVNQCGFNKNNCRKNYGTQLNHCSGGGMFFTTLNDSSLITNCSFDSNYVEGAVAEGGGLYTKLTFGKVDSCDFTNNYTLGSFSNGGGACHYSYGYSRLRISNCNFEHNNSNLGGGLYNESKTLQLYESKFTDNVCLYGNAGYGGGLVNYYSPYAENDTTIIPGFTRNCTFIHNKAFLGGGMANMWFPFTVDNCIFMEDTAEYGGGGIWNVESASTLNNNLFLKNIAGVEGGAIYSEGASSSIKVTNCTIWNNLTTAGSSAIYNLDTASLEISNSIVLSNSSGIINEQGSSTIARYSLIQGFVADTISHILPDTTDPLFVSISGNINLALQSGSPCINTGINNVVEAYSDLAGNFRISGGIVDLGAYEHLLPPVVLLGNDTILCEGENLVLNAGFGASEYLWNTGDTVQTIQVNVSGTYYVTATNNLGTSIDTIQVIYSPVPSVNLGNDTTITQGSSIILNAGNTGSTYVWSTGATTQTINVTYSGTYSVVVTNNAGCTGTDTIIVSVNPLGINDVNTSKNSLIIFPNPTKETIHISFTNEKLLHTKAMLTDIYGRTVREIMLNSKSQELSMAGLSSGIYILKTLTGNSVKIVKQ